MNILLLKSFAFFLLIISSLFLPWKLGAKRLNIFHCNSCKWSKSLSVIILLSGPELRDCNKRLHCMSHLFRWRQFDSGDFSKASWTVASLPRCLHSHSIRWSAVAANQLFSKRHLVVRHDFFGSWLTFPAGDWRGALRFQDESANATDRLDFVRQIF